MIADENTNEDEEEEEEIHKKEENSWPNSILDRGRNELQRKSAFSQH